MSISTYDELKAAIATWTHRTDLTSVIPDFIMLAESRINRDFGFNQQEVETELTGTLDSRYIDLPAGFISPIALWFTTWLPRKKLTFSSPEKMAVTDTSTIPNYWTIDGDKIAFEAPLSDAYTFEFRYCSTIALTDANPTNWMLTNHPDVYLYAAAIEAAAYMRDDYLINLAANGYQSAKDGVNFKEHRTKAMEEMTTELGRPVSPNIITGDDP